MNGTQVPVCSSGCMTAPPTGMMRLPAAAETERGPAWAGPRKKLLAICQIMQYNKDKANKGRDVESWNLPTPLCRRCDLPHSRISAPHSLYRDSPFFTRGNCRAGSVCRIGLCRVIIPAQPFYSPRPEDQGAGSPAPRLTLPSGENAAGQRAGTPCVLCGAKGKSRKRRAPIEKAYHFSDGGYAASAPDGLRNLFPQGGER